MTTTPSPRLDCPSPAPAGPYDAQTACRGPVGGGKRATPKASFQHFPTAHRTLRMHHNSPKGRPTP